jgi:hypothetical protein
VSRTGTDTAPIVIREPLGAILDGADPESFTWTPGAGGVFSTTVNQPDPHLVLAQVSASLSLRRSCVSHVTRRD